MIGQATELGDFDVGEFQRPDLNLLPWRMSNDSRPFCQRDGQEGSDRDGLGQDGRAKKRRSGLPKEVGAPEAGICRDATF